MKMSEILGILAQASLPSLTREQLHTLANTNAGKRFGEALRAFGAGDATRRGELEAVVLAMAPSHQQTLTRLGYQATTAELVDIALIEQDQLLKALVAIAANASDAQRAKDYIATLGLPRSAPEQAAPPYYSFKIFGTTAALCISEAQIRTGKQYTVQVEGAVALAGPGRTSFDWPNKITVQLTVQEAYQTLALFENKLRAIRFDGHGRAHDKSLHAELQDSHYFVRMMQRGRPAIAVPVRAVDALPLVSLLYKQLLRNEPHLSLTDIRAMVDRMAAMMAPERLPSR
jgi:hypothetical protein